jgi:hypothetical protein
MKRAFQFLIVTVLVAFVGAPALAGVQVTTCEELTPGTWHYTFFACTPNVNADGLIIRLLPSEVGDGEVIVGCSVPAIAGFSCANVADEATFSFPEIGPFECVPDLPGDANKFALDIMSADGVTLVEEIWTLGGSVQAGFISVITCPPVSVEDSSWGSVKALYR